MGAFERLKDFFTVDEEDEDVTEDTLDEREEVQNSGLRVLNGNQSRQKQISETSLARVMVYEPIDYKDATGVIDSLKSNKIVIIKLENVKESKKSDMSAIQVKQQIFECINGAVYALEGTIEKLSETIFLLAPKNVDVDANTLETSFSDSYVPKWNRQ